MNETVAPIGDISLDEAVEFIWTEADMLDHHQYEDWLALWTADGKYVIPGASEESDYENQLNYAYDDAAMRQMRVARLVGGMSISANSAARTVRTVSRFRLISSAAGVATLRCAQILVEYRREHQRTYPANVTYRLRATEQGLRLESKVIRLVDAADALAVLGYLM